MLQLLPNHKALARSFHTLKPKSQIIDTHYPDRFFVVFLGSGKHRDYTANQAAITSFPMLSS
jgi:hypothetical protein